jgi:arsenate reductase
MVHQEVNPLRRKSINLYFQHFFYMIKVYHLSTCGTCKKIIQRLELPADAQLQDIKKTSITPEQLDEMRRISGSYESLFSRKSLKYRPMGLHERVLTEDDYRQLILAEYSFLKRPVVMVDDQIFIGNAEKTILEAEKALRKG